MKLRLVSVLDSCPFIIGCVSRTWGPPHLHTPRGGVLYRFPELSSLSIVRSDLAHLRWGVARWLLLLHGVFPCVVPVYSRIFKTCGSGGAVEEADRENPLALRADLWQQD